MTVDKSLRYLKEANGGECPKPLTGTSPLTGPFFAIQAGANGLTFANVTLSPPTGDDWNGFALAAGQTVVSGRAQFTSVTLSAGTAIVYKSPDEAIL